jgi:HSP90 family molecular chaperone
MDDTIAGGSSKKMLAGAGRLKTGGKPILELNAHHDLVRELAALGDDERAFKQDAAHLLFDEARVLDGERPAEARMFLRSLGASDAAQPGHKGDFTEFRRLKNDVTTGSLQRW